MNKCVWYLVEIVGVVDAKQVMTCKSTSVTDICIDSEAGRQVCESHQISIREERLETAAHLPHSDSSPASAKHTKHVRRVCQRLMLQRKNFFLFYKENVKCCYFRHFSYFIRLYIYIFIHHKW